MQKCVSLKKVVYQSVLLLAVISLALAACGPAPTPTASTGDQPTQAPQAEATATKPMAQISKETEAPKPTTTPAEKYGERPAFVDMVAAGELEPVEERLPKNPYVAEGVDGVGVYGGELTWATRVGAGAAMVRMMEYEHLVRWDKEWTKLVPNVAESYEASEDATEFTFHLREGMKWSDGSLFTTEDIRFTVEEVMGNKEVMPSFPAWLVAGGEPVQVEVVDDYTITFKFAAPNGLFLMKMATTDGYWLTNTSKAFAQKFMPEYNPEAEKLAEEAGAASWQEMLTLIYGFDGRFNYPERPTLAPWVLTAPMRVPTSRLVAEPNPYYWKVDVEGNQLPYIDEFVAVQSDDYENLLLQTLNGEIRFAYAYINTDVNKPTLFENQEKGNYHLLNAVLADANTNAIAFNLTHEDPVKREVFNNKDFRIGLSYAINRQEIIDLIYMTQGVPAQVGPLPGTEYYNEQLFTQYVEYDVDKANEFLDVAYPEKDSEGYRLGPDGKRIQIIVACDNAGEARCDALQLISNYWKAVGVWMEPRMQDRTFFYDEKAANKHEANDYQAPGGLGIDVLLQPRFYFPYDGESNFAIPWANWGNGAEAVAEEPPAPAQRQIELYKMIKETGDAELQTEYMKEILQIAADEFYVFGISTPPMGYMVVANDLHGVMDNMPSSWAYPNPNPAEPYTWYVK